jgi:hypothetical protein
MTKQEVHELAIAFATAEYENELARRKMESIEAPQQRASMFYFLYTMALQDFMSSAGYPDS